MILVMALLRDEVKRRRGVIWRERSCCWKEERWEKIERVCLEKGKEYSSADRKITRIRGTEKCLER